MQLPALLLALAVVPETPLLERFGCVKCHSTDGTRRSAPSFAGLYESELEVLVDDVARTVRADRAYLERSIREPGAELVPGFPDTSMPEFPMSEEELAGLVDEIVALAGERRRDSSPALYALAGLLFLFGHLGLSSWPVRTRLVAAVGGQGFMLLYSLVAGGSLTWLMVKWNEVPFIALWTPPDWTRWIVIAGMPLVSILAFGMSKSILPLGWNGEPTGEAKIRGLHRITRHPSLWSTALWGILHLTANGDFAAIVAFGSLTLLSLLGMLHIEARYARRYGERWTRVYAESSVVPFAAILRGRTRLDLREIGWAPFLVGLGVYVALLLGHGWLFGASPLPL